MLQLKKRIEETFFSQSQRSMNLPLTMKKNLNNSAETIGSQTGVEFDAFSLMT